MKTERDQSQEGVHSAWRIRHKNGLPAKENQTLNYFLFFYCSIISATFYLKSANSVLQSLRLNFAMLCKLNTFNLHHLELDKGLLKGQFAQQLTGVLIHHANTRGNFAHTIQCFSRNFFPVVTLFWNWSVRRKNNQMFIYNTLCPKFIPVYCTLLQCIQKLRISSRIYATVCPSEFSIPQRLPPWQRKITMVRKDLN